MKISTKVLFGLLLLTVVLLVARKFGAAGRASFGFDPASSAKSGVAERGPEAVSHSRNLSTRRAHSEDDLEALELLNQLYAPTLPRLSQEMPRKHHAEMSQKLVGIERPERGGNVLVDAYEGPYDALHLLADFVGWTSPTSRRSYYDDGEIVFVWRGNADTETQGYAVRKSDLSLYKWVLDDGIAGLAESGTDKGYFVESEK